MKLNTREWGAGERTALLVHGIGSDARTWRRVGPALAERGYRAVGVDLRGHGASDRAPDYPTEAYGADLVETAEALGGVDLALGHSLGGLAVLLAVEAGLRPAKAVYVDSSWRLRGPEHGFDPVRFVDFADRATAESIAELAPSWAAEDVEIEVASLAAWDRRTAFDYSKYSVAALEAGTAGDGTGLPLTAAVPSLLLLGGRESNVNPQDAETLRTRGFALRSVPGTGHSVHRDDFDGFMAALEGWI